MARFPKPAEGSLDGALSATGNTAVSYEDSISPSSTRRNAKRCSSGAWLNVGRVEQLPRKGSYFTKEAQGRNTSIIVVRNNAGEVKAFHNICRHRAATSWSGTTCRSRRTSGFCKQFTCKYHAWRYDLDGNLTFVQQEGEFLRSRQRPLRVGAGALRRLGRLHLVNFAAEPEQDPARLPRTDESRARRLSVRSLDLSVSTIAQRSRRTGSSTWTRSRSSITHLCCTRTNRPRSIRRRPPKRALKRRTIASTGRTGWSATSGIRAWSWTPRCQADGGDLPERVVRAVGRADLW